jgi:AraC-like DNA-binding protein
MKENSPKLPAEGAPRRITFDSDALDERERRAILYDVFAASICRAEISFLADQPFKASLKSALFDAGLSVVRMEASISGIRRAQRHIAADPAGLFIVSFNSSLVPRRSEQGQREVDLEPGSALLGYNAEPGQLFSPSGFSGVGLCVPQRQLLELVPDAEDRVITRLDPNSEALRHLRRYLDMIVGPGSNEQRPTADPALAEHIGNTLLDLVTLVLRADGEAAELASARGLRAARLQAILAGIQAGAADPEFKIGVLARRLGLSPRYIAKLLHDAGTSFSARLIERRLERARRMLAEPHSRHLRVSDIAYACGFSDVSYFNRCFRRRFGMSPSECR